MSFDSYFLDMRLTIDPRADKFSEDFFRELYAYYEKKFHEANIKESETEALYNNSYYKRIEEQYKKYFPAKIIDRVADTRVLAMGYVSPVNYKTLMRCKKKFNRELEKYTGKYFKKYIKYKNKLPEVLRDQSFYDSTLADISINGQDMTLFLKNTPIFTNSESDKCKLIFSEYKIIEQEVNVFPVLIVDSEVYETEYGWEFHFLISDSKKEYLYFTVACKCVDIELETE